ncbi:MAG: hypothetical protein JNN15_17230, partial [Blastocatellia bacterium]|nr:hypothetical protein [Blastocatellia bacterium]
TQKSLTTDLAILLTTARFFATLQSLLEKELPPIPDLNEIHTRMENLEASGISADANTLLEVQRALQHSRVKLAVVDNQISVSEVRILFERFGEYDNNSLGRITKYYLSKPAKDENDRDKVDLLVTRFCSVASTNEKGLKLRLIIPNLEEQMETLCRSKGTDENQSVQAAIIARLRQLGKAVTDAHSLNSVMEAKLLSQIRNFKISLSEMFYAPIVLAEIVRINVAIHNKLQHLYYAEQARLRMETARMLRSHSGSLEVIKLDNPAHPYVSQCNDLTLQMQQLLQDVKRNLAEQIMQDREVRASFEAEGGSISQLITSLEDCLKRSRDLLKKLQDVYTRLGEKGSK